MSESKSPQHPLLGPASTYSRMRKSARPEYKMRGYFHWQKARAVRLGLPLAEREREREEGYLREVACRGAGTSGEKGPDVRVIDALELEAVCVAWGARARERAHGALVLVREADGTRSVGMWLEAGAERRTHRDGPCRALLLEPEVVARLEEVVQQVCSVVAGEVLERAFAAETVAGSVDVARLLSAIPDLDGEVRGGEIRFCRVAIAGELETFPPRPGPLTVVFFAGAVAPGE